VECRNAKDEEFGQERLEEDFKKLVNTAGATSATEICHKLVDNIKKYANRHEINDDFTTMIMKFS
ncbi:MAG: SpoIIE family protein phosphatase, partial [Bacteroidetes bacterium]|nr:SpoIIE family protein phosphatase [Bacteroidota bacterium]